MYNKSAEQQKRKTSRDNASRGCLIRLVLLASDLFFCFNLKIALFQGGGRDLKLEKRPAPAPANYEAGAPAPAERATARARPRKFWKSEKHSALESSSCSFFRTLNIAAKKQEEARPPISYMKCLFEMVGVGGRRRADAGRGHLGHRVRG